MKLLHILLSKKGGLGLTTPQIAGLAATVGAVGLGTWYMVSSSSNVNQDTVFSSTDDEVVYVARGASGNGYGRQGQGGYGEGGELRSAVQIRQSKDLQFIDQDYAAAKAAGRTDSRLDREEQGVEAYKMGNTTGLGMGQNDAGDLGSGSGMGDLSGIYAQMDQIKAAAEAKAKQAQAAEGDIAAAAAAAAKGQGGKWGRNPGMASANGSEFAGSSLQGDGTPGSRRGGALGGANGGAGGPRQNSLTRTPKYEGGRDAVIKAGRSMRDWNTLEDLRLASKDVAENEARSANEAAQIFMKGTKAGGVEISGEVVTIGGPTSSKDFANVPSVNLDGLGGDAETYADAIGDLREHLHSYKKKLQGCSGIPFFAFLCYNRHWKNMKKNIDKFRESWGGSFEESHNTQGSYADRVYEIGEQLHKAAKKHWGGFFVGAIDINQKYYQLIRNLEAEPTLSDTPTTNSGAGNRNGRGGSSSTGSGRSGGSGGRNGNNSGHGRNTSPDRLESGAGNR